ncbi:MAG: hypothetical protein K2I40_01305 [Bifidobacterium castoris]|nr:hypothetical protein [Bifidobacterium castoris]
MNKGKGISVGLLASALLIGTMGCGQSAEKRLDEAFAYCHKESDEAGVDLKRRDGATDVDDDPTDTFYARCMFRQLDTPQSVIDLMTEMPNAGNVYATQHDGIYYLWELRSPAGSDIMFSTFVPPIVDENKIYFKEA